MQNIVKKRKRGNKTVSYTNLSAKEIMQWCEVLDISNDEINKYFFTPKVQ